LLLQLFNNNDKVSVDVTTGLFQEVVHHYTVPQFGVVVFEFGVSCKFNPVVLNHIFQCLIATQRSQSALSCNLLNVAADHIVQSESLKCPILPPNHSEFPLNLPNQKPPLEKLKRNKPKSKYIKVSLHEPRIFVRGEFDPEDCTKQPTQ